MTDRKWSNFFYASFVISEYLNVRYFVVND